MPNHEVSLGDVYTLVTEIKTDVIAIQAKLDNVRDTSRDHESRLREVESQKAPSLEVAKLSVALEDLKRKVYMFSGGAVVISAIVGPVINTYLGK